MQDFDLAEPRSVRFFSFVSDTTSHAELINLTLIYLTPYYLALLKLINDFPPLSSMSKTSVSSILEEIRDAAMRMCLRFLCVYLPVFLHQLPIYE